MVEKLDHRLDLYDKTGVKPATTGNNGRLRGSFAMLTTLSEPPSDWAYFLAANYGTGRYKVSDRTRSWRFVVDDELSQRAKVLSERAGRESGWTGGLFLAPAPSGERRHNPGERAAAPGAAPSDVDALRAEMRAMLQALRDDLAGNDDDEEDDDEDDGGGSGGRGQNPADALRGAINLVAEAKAVWGESQDAKPSFDWSVVVDGLMRAMSARPAAPSSQGSLPLGAPAQNPAPVAAAAAPPAEHAEQWGIIVSALESAGITPDVAARMVLPYLQGAAPAAAPAPSEAAPVAL